MKQSAATKGKSIARAIELLAAGDVVAIPTETVYGLAGNIYSKSAIDKIYRVKKRPRTNPLIVHVAGVEQAQELVKEFPVAALKLAKAFWPGPLTMILPKNKRVPAWLTAGQSTVGIRVPDHALTLRLLKRSGFPLAAPSANPFKYISPVTATQVQQMLGAQLPYILDGGRCRRGIESTIVSFSGGKAKILRPGAITAEDIRKVTGAPLSGEGKTRIPHPGMYKKHYAPHTPLVVAKDLKQAWQERGNQRTALICFRRKRSYAPARNQVVLSPGGDLSEAAANLYQALHQLDKGGYGLIIAEALPDKGLGLAINDRLRKAGKSGS